MKFVKDIKNGTPMIRIYDEKYEYSYGYYTSNEWVDPTKIVLARNPDFRNTDLTSETELVLIDLEKETEEVICTSEEYGTLYNDYVVHKDKVYYVTKEKFIYCKNIFTGEKKLIFQLDEDGEMGMMSHPHITADGRYLNITCHPKVLENTTGDKNIKEGNWGSTVVDVETGEAEMVFEIRFENPYHCADHMMICPTDKDKVFFAHEGITYYISNRLWLWERGKGTRCIAKQNLMENGFLGDCFGHECWAQDGKGIYFVKYPCSPKGPTGICYVGMDGKQTDVLYDGYPYWHVCTSPSGRYLAADATSYEKGEPEYSGVYLIDMEKGTEKEVVRADVTFRHPCHPHPKFNLDTTKFVYHELYKDRICVNVVEMKDIT